MFRVGCWMLSFFASFHILRVGPKKALPWAFLLIFSASISAQPLQKIYSGLDNATSISVTQNHIYIVEQGKNRLLKLDHSGTLIETIGGRGSGDYQFSKPVDVDATNGLKVFVTDFNNRRVQVFDRRGQYLSSIEARNTFGEMREFNPSQIAVDQMGEVYFTDSETRYIHHFDLDYNVLDEFKIPNEIKTVHDLSIGSSEIFILDWGSGTIHRLTLNGAYQGFYPAEEVLAFFADESGLWTSYTNQLIYESKSGEEVTVPFDSSVEPLDMYVERTSIFLLTKAELFKLSVPER